MFIASAPEVDWKLVSNFNSETGRACIYIIFGSPATKQLFKGKS
jgi:hypothetical protein